MRYVASMMEQIHRLQARGILGLDGPFHAEIQRLSRMADGALRGQYHLVGSFPGGSLELPGYGGIRTIRAAQRALTIFEAGGSAPEALAAALHAQHPKEEHDAI